MNITRLKKENYPFLLRQIPSPPKEMDMAGQLPSDDNKFLCVVGSRTHTSYGSDAVKKIISGLAGYPIVIISGLAIGIDSLSHQAALDAKLTTVGFPGSGLSQEVLYPYSRRGLAADIIDAGGTLLSPFKFHQSSMPWTFPSRNRLMAGMAHAALIIEAAQGSGTLITADFATEFNRDILAIPGSIFSDLSYGPHMLISRGAVPVTSSADVLETLGFKVDRTNPKKHRVAVDMSSLSPTEHRIFQSVGRPIERDELIRELGIPINEANAILISMELKGILVESGSRIQLA